MLMGLGGNWIQQLFSRQGGTAWGDIFMVNLDGKGDPARRLRQIVESGHRGTPTARAGPGKATSRLTACCTTRSCIPSSGPPKAMPA